MLNKNANVIYMDSDEKHVGAVVIYADYATGVVWYDKEFTKPISNEEMVDLVNKGLATLSAYDEVQDVAFHCKFTGCFVANEVVTAFLLTPDEALVVTNKLVQEPTTVEETEEPSEPTE